MEYKKNFKYFYPNWIMVIVGCCIAAFGLFFIIITQYVGSYFLGFVIIGAGIAVFFFTGMLKDSDIDEQVETIQKTVDQKAIKEFGFNERQLKTITTQSFGEFEFPEGETLHVKRGSDGKFRSSIYDAWSVSLGSDDLYFYVHRFSLTEATESFSQKTISLDGYAGTAVTEHTYIHKHGKDGAKTLEVKYSTFDVRSSDGAVYSLPVHPSMDIEEYREKLDRFVKTRRNSKAQG